MINSMADRARRERARGIRTLAAVTCLLALGATSRARAAEAQVQTDAAASEKEEPLAPTTFGVGLQTSWPSFGLSGMMDLDERVAVQGIVGLFGRVNMFAGKGLYRFSVDELWSAYGYGAVGAVSYKFLRDRQTTLGLGAGVGLEYDWRAWQRKLPPLRWNIEVGLAYADFDFYDYTGLSFGAGLHYRF